MKLNPLIGLFIVTWVHGLTSACAATAYDLTEKYAGVIGKQYRTTQDAYICKMPRHQFDFIPYRLDISVGGKEPRLAHIPIGTIVTVKAAKRSYVGGDWDYVIAEVRAPETGQIYAFEELLGSSTYFPGDIEKLWEPMDKSPLSAMTMDSGAYYHAPNGRFSIRAGIITSPLSVSTVEESNDPSSVSYYFHSKEILRIDYWHAPLVPLKKWTRDSPEANIHDRTLAGALKYAEAKTSGLQELRVVAKRTSATFAEDMSAVAFRMKLRGGEYAGVAHRGFLCFTHGQDSYILNYQTSETFPDDQSAGNAVVDKLIALKDAMVFHTP